MWKRQFAAFVLVMLAATGAARGEEDQPEGLPPTISALVQATGALTKSAAPPLENRRTEVLLYRIRQQLSLYLTEKDLAQPPTLPKVSGLLCDPRVKQVALRASITYLDAVTAEVKKTAKSEITDSTDLNNIIVAFKALFANYQVQVDSKDMNSGEVEADIKKSCEGDINDFAGVYYGLKPVDESGVIAAFTTLFELFKSIVAPVIVEGAKFIDEQKRLDRIKKFLKDEKTQKLISSNAANLRDYLAKIEQIKTAEAVGHFVEAYTRLGSSLKPAKDVKECAEFNNLPVDKHGLPANGLPSREFVTCFSAMWGSMKDAVTDVAKAASDYDQHADVGTKQELAAFEKINTNLAKIASGEDDAPTFNAVWQAAMRIIAIGDKIEKANSKENRDKIAKAIKDIVDAL
ncbi:hypothetical protein [Bradyrhizobium sp.]|uniref:hypothetical protein n=1 Tax=Bradyrhizobium sp. TaxID=376 RepID=UPI002DDD9AC3|nr:hypothetical protein [Bradyrhizobium sp.]HEV2153662.1 hypothetical protein [Bradyrhizobium sp.]